MAGRAPRVVQVPQVAGAQIQPLHGQISRPLCRYPGGVLGGAPVSRWGSAGGAGPAGHRRADPAPSRPDLASPVPAPRWGAGRGSGGLLCSASGSSSAGRRRLDVATFWPPVLWGASTCVSHFRAPALSLPASAGALGEIPAWRSAGRQWRHCCAAFLVGGFVAALPYLQARTPVPS